MTKQRLIEIGIGFVLGVVFSLAFEFVYDQLTTPEPILLIPRMPMPDWIMLNIG